MAAAFAAVFILFGHAFPACAALKTRSPMPPLAGVKEWAGNEGPRTREALAGKVVLVEFWNYTRGESLRRIPVLRHWQEKYGPYGFEVLSVHGAEFAFEKIPAHVSNALKRHRINYPVAMDPDLSMHQAYHLGARPAHCLIDAEGNIRATFYGSGGLAQTEKNLQELLKEREGYGELSIETDVFVASQDPRPGLRLGYREIAGYGNDEILKARVPQAFKLPLRIQADRFYLEGRWQFEEESVRLTEAPGRIVVRSSAPSLQLIAGSAQDTSVEAEILIEGKPLAAAEAGADVLLRKGRSLVLVKSPRLYEILHEKERGLEKTLEIRPASAGALFYGIRFGAPVSVQKKEKKKGGEEEAQEISKRFDV